MKTKSVAMWLRDEELWFELYYHLSIAESRTRGILVPRSSAVHKAFNETLVGQVIKDNRGQDTAPRAERQVNAFASKFTRACPQLKARLNQCVFGKSGDVFVPKITMKMLHAYKEMKTAMEAKGINNESAYSENLVEWQHLFSHLPNSKDVEMQDEFLESDAAAVLLSMANKSAMTLKWM
jgi:hypothetical protein